MSYTIAFQEFGESDESPVVERSFVIIANMYSTLLGLMVFSCVSFREADTSTILRPNVRVYIGVYHYCCR